MARYRIALLPGDGIGLEVSRAAKLVLNTLNEKFRLGVDIVEVEGGDECRAKRGVALPNETVDAIADSHACLKGPVGETAMDVVVRLRQIFDLYANVRPFRSYPGVPCLKQGIDFVIVRENTEDLYKGMEFEPDEDTAVALMVITRKGSERIAEYAFKLCEGSRKKTKMSVVAVHKANVLRKTTGLFAKVCREVAARHKSVNYSEMLVDTAALNLIRNPESFDVLLTTNMFGDILSDEAAQLVGGLGVAPSANVGDDRGLFEAVHGAAPDIAGKGIANPLAILLSSKMMLEWMASRHSDENLLRSARALDEKVLESLNSGYLTPDLGGSKRTDEIASFISSSLLKDTE